LKLCKIGVGLTGYPGAGKTLLAAEASRMGLPVLNMGDVVREEADKRGVEPTRENMTRLMFKLREEEGPLAVARRILDKCRRVEGKLVVIDGLRTVDELRLFKESFKRFILVMVDAPREERFRRLHKRGRSDDPKTLEELVDRDRAEETLGLGELMKKADRLIVNSGPPEKALKTFRAILEEASRLDP